MSGADYGVIRIQVKRVESLLKFLTEQNLIIINKGSEPTFVFPSFPNWNGWEAILDMTITNN